MLHRACHKWIVFRFNDLMYFGFFLVLTSCFDSHFEMENSWRKAEGGRRRGREQKQGQVIEIRGKRLKVETGRVDTSAEMAKMCQINFWSLPMSYRIRGSTVNTGTPVNSSSCWRRRMEVSNTSMTTAMPMPRNKPANSPAITKTILGKLVGVLGV